MTSVPGLNEKRRLTSVTNIKMELVEPAGITLLEKIKAAAANNGFLDHLDAPYMLTVEFKGFDENGKSRSLSLKQVNEGECGGWDALIPEGAKIVPPGKRILEFTSERYSWFACGVYICSYGYRRSCNECSYP